MDVHRFILKAYPSENHPEFNEWQRATLVLFVADPNPYVAEKKALDELKRRAWVPESFEHRDTLIRTTVEDHGGEVWEAYLLAEKDGLFWLQNLDSLPMCKKGEVLWGTGPLLTENFVDKLISDSGGHRLTAEEAGQFLEKNADYILGNYVLELKQFENEGLSVNSRKQKIAELFQRYLSKNGPVRKIDPYELSERDFEEYWEILGVPIQKRIQVASKQVKATIARLGQERYEGGVVLMNTGYLSVPHDFLVAMAERYASKDTSSIKHVIVISSWTITNGFDTVGNYGFHPHEPTCAVLRTLKDVFWGTVVNLMTQMIKGELDAESVMQQPMSPTYFNHNGEAFVFGVPQLASSLKRSKNEF